MCTRRFVRLAVVAMLVAVPVWAASDPSRQAEATTADYERLDAHNTYDLAIDIARQLADGDLARLTDLIIATGEHPTDAIVSAGLAGYLDTCPRPDGRPCNRTATLLTRPDTLPEAVADAIAASGVPAERITVLGGTTAISNEVHRQIGITAGWNSTGANPVIRVAGATRYDTATTIATHITGLATRPGGLPLPASYRTIIVANGDHPADALAASTLAYRSGHLLLLAPGTAPIDALRQAIDTLDAHCALVIGGTNALPATLDTQLADALAATGTGACTPERIAGTDRHHTAALIATRLADDHGAPVTALLTSSDTRPLPLTAAPLSRTNAALLSTRTDQLPNTTRDWLSRHPTITRITVIGPETSVSPQVAAGALDTTITAPTTGGSGGGAGGGFSLNYASTEFLTSATSQTLSPTINGGTGPYTYAIINGTLPTGVSFDTTTGTFTGPTTWNLGFATVSAGYDHTCAVLTDTTARCWGNGSAGQLGNGTTAHSFHPSAVLASGTPTATPVTLSGITQISSGHEHTCVVLTDTTARCWGLGFYGGLGDGTDIARTNPVAVLASGTQASNPVTLSGITSIHAGMFYTCAVLTDTTARCWGRNYEAQLGDGTTNNEKWSPVAVLASGTQNSNPVTLSGITQISPQRFGANNTNHTCAVLADGTARCWGRNGNGRLGDGTTVNRSNPVAVLASGTQASSPVTLSGVTQISAGFAYTCAVMTDTTGRCWGSNTGSKLGDGTNDERRNPVAVLASGTQAMNPVTLSGITQVTSGVVYTCAVLTDSTARCWGDNANGKLGDGTATGRSNPVAVLASGTQAMNPVTLSGITQISTSKEHTCSILANGGARCWGEGGNSFGPYGRLGDGVDATTQFNPVRVLASGTEASNPVVFGGVITLAPTTVTVTVTDSTAATADRVVTLTSA